MFAHALNTVPLPASKGNWHYYGEAALTARGSAVAIRMG